MKADLDQTNIVGLLPRQRGIGGSDLPDNWQEVYQNPMTT